MAVDVVDEGPITFTVDDATIRVQDRIEGQTFQLAASGDLSPQPALTDLFVFPVDSAISITTTELELDPHFDAYIRDEDGTHLGGFEIGEQSFSVGTYFIELTGRMKIYLRISDAGFSATCSDLFSNDASLNISFDSASTVSVGARSLHTRPQDTITTSNEPDAMMEAISYLGSSIKEFSCERSWPSIRGHPPLIELSDSLEIPPALTKPETGITISVPPTRADIYRIAPLVFYLGADVEPGDRAAIHLDNGYTEPLRSSHLSLDESVDRLLDTCILMDSLVRIGGYYTCSRREYRELAPELPFYPPNLYSESLSDQLIEYLEVPFSVIEPYLPERPLTTVLHSGESHVKFLPYLCNKLAKIRVEEVETATELDTSRTQPTATPHGHVPGSPESAYLVHDSFINSLSNRPTTQDRARFTFIISERGRRGFQESISEHPMYVTADEAVSTIIDKPTKRELKRVLTDESDFLHCDLAVVDDGFECVDGVLPVDEIETVSTKFISVSGCNEPDIGVSLVEKGAVAGICTASSPSSLELIRLSGYLRRGFSPAMSAQLAELSASTSYRFFGDPTYTVVANGSGHLPVCMNVTSTGLDTHSVDIYYQPTDRYWIGSTSTVYDESSAGSYQLCGSTIEQPHSYTTPEIVSCLEDDDFVVRLNGSTYHGEVPPSESLVRNSARSVLSDSQKQ
ncbi:hypothetical protein [Natrononativus amylolyticus]|uniref:hypothetical protein n=1 Tax=Natrononativus amylolyticus TaxID=2963434 RepID=UPI0020CE0CB9|nr:hypothetical protein [Natrononativus amylolyticus]